MNYTFLKAENQVFLTGHTNSSHDLDRLPVTINGNISFTVKSVIPFGKDLINYCMPVPN